MPIKFPKFSRRKSAGNALEAGYEPANPDNQFTPSHEPDESRPTKYGGGYTSAQRQNRGSGHTNGSGYSGSEYYASTGSLNRLSSSSTLPSADAPRTPASVDDHRNQPGGLYNTAKSPKSIGASSGKRSFGGTHGPTSPGRKDSMSTATPPRLDTALDTSSLFGEDMFSFTTSRTTARPESSGGMGHTAPKLASSSIINTSDNHNDISPVPPPKSYNPGNSPTTSRLSYAAYNNIYANPSHMDVDRPGANEYSPYGWDAKDSDELIAPTMPAASNNSPRNSRNLTPGQSLPTPSHSHTDSLTTPSARQSRVPKQHPSRGGSGDSLGLKRTSAVMRRQSFPEDEDAALVAQSVASHKHQQSGLHGRPQPQKSSLTPLLVGSAKGLMDKVKDRDSGWDEGVASGSSSHNSYPGEGSSSASRDNRGTSPAASRGNIDYAKADATPRAKKSGTGFSVQLSDGNDIDFDSSISASAALAVKYQENEVTKPPQNKVMTPAQFERYRQQQDEQRRLSGNQADPDDYDGSDSSESEEESEAERNREAVKQRQKQEAHLAVYRQQMMKITGSQPAEQPLGMNSRGASMSTSALPLNTSMPQLSLSGPGSSGKDSEEEDEEVPLGILMAHGFPNKNRPPTRLSNASSQPNLRQAALNQQDPRLPPFARGLPQDPHNLGASILHPANRMSMAYGVGNVSGSVAGSVYGGPSEMPGPRRPGGLIGEIMRTEEAKAARKGGSGSMTFPTQRNPFQADPFRPVSPGGGLLGLGGGSQHGNAGMMGGNPGLMGQTGMGGGMNMGVGGMPGTPNMGMMGPGAAPAGQGDAMQMQMANQMQQMMNMQMQWMQMQMQGQQQQQQQMLLPPMMGQRPMSMAGSTSASAFSLGGQHQRTMSMMEPPNIPFQQPGRPSYTPSIAPSQRGPMMGSLQPPQGYAPSIAPSERSTVGLPSRYRPVSYNPAAATGPASARTATLLSGAGQDWNKKPHGPSHLKSSGGESDDEDEGWEELEKKRKEKKEGWRKKKDTGFKGILNFGSTST
ncbi:hypothetical protein L873DRAFT_1711062 [Choiromyces venosus 120613-1]|uniref:Uncharacterized protein n=1 Tax=Choiromyces venosus 120613-1 TaxID=1336337 RepID=A0A3N4J6S0_9PEZI|nr:hypothetical protein L873DRAFT_1711062 [Choiromyces venosus 120613-1]